MIHVECLIIFDRFLNNKLFNIDRVRFTAPVPVKSYVRGRVFLKEFKEIKNGAKLTVEVTVELKDNEKPACVAEQVFLIYE